MRVEARDGRSFGGLSPSGLAGEMSFGFDLCEGERHSVRIAEAGEGVDPGAAWIAEAEELGNFVVSFAGSIVDGAADERIAPGLVSGLSEIEMRVSAGDDEGQGLRLSDFSLKG